MSKKYPKLQIIPRYYTENIAAVIKRCEKCSVTITGIIKGFNGLPQLTKACIAGGVKSIGSSRLEQLCGIREEHPEVSLMLIRTPMLSEVGDVVRMTDISLNTEPAVIDALNKEALKQGKVHGIMLMLDVGDLREGFWDREVLVDTAEKIEKMEGLRLDGVGTNVGCYGAIEPTVETLEKLAVMAENIEERIGRRLELVSGGASSSLMRIWDQDMPPKINHLRIGGEAMLAHTNQVVYGYDESDLHRGAFRLQAEIVRIVKTSDTEEAVLDIGTADYCYDDALYPLDRGIRIKECCFDYTVADIRDSKEDYELGDILTFDLSYGALVYLTKSRSVNVEFIDK